MTPAIPETGRLASLLGAIEATIREPDAVERRAMGADAWLEGRGLTAEDRAALAAVDDRSFFVYRRLVRKGLHGAIALELPRTARRLGARFGADVERFLSERLPRSHYLRDVAFEFLEHIEPTWRSDRSVPPFTVDLARHELVAFEVAAEPSSDPDGVEELSLEQKVRFAASVRVRRYEYPVHELDDVMKALAARPTVLLAYRDREHDVRYLELTPLAALVIERLAAGDPLGQAVTQACAEQGVALDKDVLDAIALVLSELAERGVLLGAEQG